MLTRKRTHGLLRLLVISSIFIICFLLVRNLVREDDTSTTFIAPDALQNASSSCRLTTSNEQRCYPLLVNFAHGCCKRAQKNNCLTGLQYGLHQCVMFDKGILDNNPDFVERNKKILQRKRGAGYWLWKPYIIFRELYLASDGDIIVYSDASVNFIANISYLTRLTEKQDILVFRLIGWKVSGPPMKKNVKEKFFFSLHPKNERVMLHFSFTLGIGMDEA